MTPDLTPGGPRAAAVCEYLAEEGYRASVTDLGHVVFHYREAIYNVSVDEDDPTYLRIVAANIHPLSGERERWRAFEAAAEVQWQYKAVKVTLTPSDVWVSCELFLADEGDVAVVFSRALDTVRIGVRAFGDRMRAADAASAV